MAFRNQLFLSIRSLLDGEAMAHRKLMETRRAIEEDFPLNKKLQLADALKRNVDTTQELIHVIDRQLGYFPKYFWWRKKVLNVDVRLKEALLLEKGLVDREVELDQIAWQELSKRAKSTQDGEVIAIYRELFQATLEEEKIAGHDFKQEEAATSMETQSLKYADHFMRNLAKQKALVVEIKGQASANVPPSQAVYDGKIAVERLSALLGEEERFHTTLIREEYILLALEKKLIDHFAKPTYWKVRKNKAKTQLRNYILVGSALAVAGYLVLQEIERKVMPTKPGYTPTEITREIESTFRQMKKGGFAQIVKTEAGEIRVVVAKEIADKKIRDINVAVDMAITLMVDRIYNVYIQELAKLLGQNETLTKLGYDLGFFGKGKEETKKAIRTTLDRQYRQAIIKMVEEDVAKNAEGWDRFWNWAKTGGGRSEFGRGGEQEGMNALVQKLEPMIAEALDEAMKRTKALLKSAAEEAAKRTAEGLAPNSVREYVRPTIDLLIVNWHWLGIGVVGLAGFSVMLFKRREKRALRMTFKGGFIDATKHSRQGRGS